MPNKWFHRYTVSIEDKECKSQRSDNKRCGRSGGDRGIKSASRAGYQSTSAYSHWEVNQTEKALSRQPNPGPRTKGCPTSHCFLIVHYFLRQSVSLFRGSQERKGSAVRNLDGSGTSAHKTGMSVDRSYEQFSDTSEAFGLGQPDACL